MLHVYELIKEHEGLRLKPYRCTAGKLTIGYGHNLDDNGITEDQAELMLVEDVAAVEKELSHNLPWFADLDIVRQSVLIDMAFNLGWPRLSNFKKSLAYMESGEFDEAAMEMLDSRWANQVGKRALRLADMMRMGEWPE